MINSVSSFLISMAGMLAIGLVVGIIVGEKTATDRERALAVEAKAGRWVVEPMTGHTGFVYGRVGE